MTLAVGQILQSRYCILQLLGQGGMGAVYLAEHVALAGRRFAVKECVPDPAASPSALTQIRQQFHVEASTLASLDHPCLPKVSDFFSESGNEYLVMDYIEGEDLRSILQRQGAPLPEKQVVIWVDQILDALEYLHSRQPYPVIHRDIKPGNIILTPQDEVRLVDFGLVKLYDPTDPRTATAMRGMGTPEYTPLEQYATGRHTDTRSDIYALGATLYHVLTNVAPCEVTQRILDPTKQAAPCQANPALSAALESVILKAMEIYPDDRFQTAGEMRAALAAVRTPLPAVSKRSRAGRGGWLVGIVSLLLVVGVGSRIMRPAPVTPPTPTLVPISTPPATSTSTSMSSPTSSPSSLGGVGAISSSTPTPTRTAALSVTPTATRVLSVVTTPTATLSGPASEPGPTASSLQPIATRILPSATVSRPSLTQVVLSAPQLISPAASANISGGVEFVWSWSGPVLDPNQGFEVRIWREGQADHYGAAGPVRTTAQTFDIGGAYGVQQGGNGEYWWTVALVQLDPYRRIGPEALPHKVVVSLPGGGGSSPRWTPPPP